MLHLHGVFSWWEATRHEALRIPTGVVPIGFIVSDEWLHEGGDPILDVLA
jgi:hypothetical protein